MTACQTDHIDYMLILNVINHTLWGKKNFLQFSSSCNLNGLLNISGSVCKSSKKPCLCSNTVVKKMHIHVVNVYWNHLQLEIKLTALFLIEITLSCLHICEINSCT